MTGDEHGAREPEGLELHVMAPCPHCGGQNPWELSQRLSRCAFCDSLLWWPYPEDAIPHFVAADRASEPERLADVLGIYDALRVQASLAAQLERKDESQSLGNPLDDPRLPPLHEIREGRRHLFEVLEDYVVHAPYLMASMVLAYHTLGRTRPQGRKAFRTLCFSCEEFFPAYPPPWDFRDKGLWLGRRELRPLADADLRSGSFIAPRDVHQDDEEATRRYLKRRQILEADLDVMDFRGTVAASHRWWVYRPYHCLLAKTPDGIAWHLVDGQFGTIAGWPTAEEVDYLLAGRWKKLGLERATGGSIHILPSRCPECGWDLRLSPKGLLQLCNVCGRLLEASPDGLRPAPYGTLAPGSLPWAAAEESGGVAWLPFWVLRGSWTVGGREVQDWIEAVRALAPTLSGARGGLPESLRTFYVPAFPSWTLEGYDAWAFACAAELTLAGPEPSDERLVQHRELRPEDRVVLPTVEQTSAASLFPETLPSYLPVPAQVQFTAPILRALAGCPFKAGATGIVYAPVPVVQQPSGPSLRGPSGTVPYRPLRDGTWSPISQRTVRKRLAPAASKIPVYRPSSRGRLG